MFLLLDGKTKEPLCRYNTGLGFGFNLIQLKIKDGCLATVMISNKDCYSHDQIVQLLVWRIHYDKDWSLLLKQRVTIPTSSPVMPDSAACDCIQFDFDVLRDVVILNHHAGAVCMIRIYRLSTGEQTGEIKESCSTQEVDEAGQIVDIDKIKK